MTFIVNLVGLVAGPLGFEPRVFGFLPPMRPEADALIRAGLRALFQNKGDARFKTSLALFLN